jgi:hypothetical protein
VTKTLKFGTLITVIILLTALSSSGADGWNVAGRKEPWEFTEEYRHINRLWFLDPADFGDAKIPARLRDKGYVVLLDCKGNLFFIGDKLQGRNGAFRQQLRIQELKEQNK